MTCARCQTAVILGMDEHCWYCFAVLCGPCWEAHGHCGHAGAEAINAQIRAHYAREEARKEERG